MKLSVLHPPTWRSSFVSAIQTSVSAYVASHGRSGVFSVLEQGLLKGRLAIEDKDGAFGFGDDDSSSMLVTMKVHDANLWTRIMISNDLGVSEAYMEGDFEVSSLKDLLNLWLDNKDTLGRLSNLVSSTFAYYSALAINTLGRQTLSMARWNVEIAYDTSNAFFESFLSKEMMYSCALWSDQENGVRGDLTVGPRPGDLEAAQHRKIHNILHKARAALLGCTVDTITLSSGQADMTRRRAVDAGVGDKVHVHLCDYRQLPADFEHAFDALVACEMVEAVGPRHMNEFFRIIDWALKPDRATIVLTATAQPEHRWSQYQPDDFSRHYHWPNTHLPSAISLPNAIQVAVPGKFVLYNIEDHGILDDHAPKHRSYVCRRFEENFHGPVVEELRRRYPSLRADADLQAFKRKWMYMFVYAEVGYARAYTSLNCWTFTRPENPSELCA
ncbi:cyclopropane-fatty-acyl-phospholipid synthase [Vararia minispora EC-137]|uniref:Cyclopropane-fatty-acyl-phospholipid synthase n=1 Tax=Vararia minispora EC-137 TaxID=1314806 RepID=A0ACB8QPQ6_9AGAM|nr:cyclopropane-fatty-acyl-phospholipid synthase [Vararia minispora EC-137]